MKSLFWLLSGIGLVAVVDWLWRKPQTWRCVATVSAYTFNIAEDMYYIATGDVLFCDQRDAEGVESLSAEDTAGAADEYLREQREDA